MLCPVVVEPLVPAPCPILGRVGELGVTGSVAEGALYYAQCRDSVFDEVTWLCDDPATPEVDNFFPVYTESCLFDGAGRVTQVDIWDNTCCWPWNHQFLNSYDEAGRVSGIGESTEDSCPDGEGDTEQLHTLDTSTRHTYDAEGRLVAWEVSRTCGNLWSEWSGCARYNAAGQLVGRDTVASHSAEELGPGFSGQRSRCLPSRPSDKCPGPVLLCKTPAGCPEPPPAE